jgi:hypothetical protein
MELGSFTKYSRVLIRKTLVFYSKMILYGVSKVVNSILLMMKSPTCVIISRLMETIFLIRGS